MASAKRGQAAKRRRKRTQSQNQELRAGELIVHIFLVAMLGVFALFTFDEKYGMMDYSKYVYLLYIAGFAAAAFLCLFIYTVATRRHALFTKDGVFISAFKSLSVADIAVLVLMAVGLISALCSIDASMAMFGSKSRYEGFMVLAIYGFIYFILSRFYTHRTYILIIYAVSVALVSLIGMLQFYGFDWFGLTASAPEVAYAFGGSFISTLGNVNVVSTFLCFAIPIFVVLYIKTQNRLRFIYLGTALLAWYLELMAHSDSGFVGLAVAFLLLLPFVLTDLLSLARLLVFSAGASLIAFIFSAIERTRVSMNIDGISRVIFDLYFTLLICAALLGALALLVWFLSKKTGGRIKLLQRVAAALVIVCVVAALAVGWLYPAKETDGILYEYTESMRGRMLDEFGSKRGIVWRASIGIFNSLPGAQKLIGVGPGMFAEHFAEQYGQESIAFAGVLYDRAHNEYLQTLVTLGILGLAAYLVLMAAVFGRAARHYENPLVLAIGGALLCFYAQAFFNFSVTIVTPYFWIFLGLFMNVAPRFPLMNKRERIFRK